MPNDAEKTRYILDNLHELNDWGSTADLYLRSFATIPTEIPKAALEAEQYLYDWPFYRAAPEIRDELIARFAKEPKETMTHYRLRNCLAMQGDDTAIQHIEEGGHTFEAGWCFDDGKRRDLTYSPAYKLTPGNTIKIGKPRAETCPHCSYAIIDLAIIDARDSRLQHLNIDGIITVTACMNCIFGIAFGLHTRFNPAGGSEIVYPYGMFYTDPNDRPDTPEDREYYAKLLEEIGSNDLDLSDTPIPDLAAARPWEDSTLGGMPGWIQGPDYPDCCQCDKPMAFLMQLQWDLLANNMDGTLYLHLCPDCNIAAVFHQQS